MSLGEPGGGGAPAGLTANAMMTGLGWVYDKVVGQPGPGEPPGVGICSDAEIGRKIRLYCASAGSAGFVTNLGGAITLPFTLPVNLLSVAALQLRLVTEIAVCRGYDVHSAEVRAAAIACLAGNAALEVFKEAGIQFGVRLGQRVVGQLAGATLARINQGIGARLLANAGTQGFANVAKLVPVMGGVIGGGIDVLSTRAAGEIAKKLFTRIDPAPEPPPAEPPPDPLRIAAA